MKDKKKLINRGLNKIYKMQEDYDILADYVVDAHLYAKYHESLHKILDGLCELEGRFEDLETYWEDDE